MQQLPVLPLGKSAIDRNAVSRNNPNLIADLLASPSTRILVLRGDEVRIHEASPGLQLFLDAPANLSQLLGVTPAQALYLGQTTAVSIDFDGSSLQPGTSVVAIALESSDAHAPAGEWHTMRRVNGALTDLDAGMFSQALALANWHRANTFCPACGAQNHLADAGWSRRCDACNKQAFPRTDPAVIVAVLDENERILLGSQGAWEANRWSILAGYVEAGESLNSAVEREVLEEAGIAISEIEFAGSQPWPFPYSLMFGFFAKASSTQPLTPDGDEIVRLRWFSRTELLAERADLQLPGKLSIARALIEAWLGQPLDREAER